MAEDNKETLRNVGDDLSDSYIGCTDRMQLISRHFFAFSSLLESLTEKQPSEGKSIYEQLTNFVHEIEKVV